MGKIETTRVVKTILVVLVALAIAACGSSAMNLMFDMPPAEPEPEPDAVPVESPEVPPGPLLANPGVAAYWQDPNAERPPIEAVTNWEEALKMLPTDKKGRADWSAALREGIVRPRALDQEDFAAKAFQMDFIMPAEKEKFDAWFPHSAHTVWLGCRNCHGSVFRYARNEMSMKQMRAGEYCGACHDKAAFTLKNCARCHPAMKK